MLLADSGSTKTDWAVVENGRETGRFLTKGINPVYQSEEEIAEAIAVELLPQLNGQDNFSALHFYGSGCLPHTTATVSRTLTAKLHVQGTVEVTTDMLGAARSLCGRERGIACILGTGSNSCLYDGESIVENVSPLGFILGDEGSGASLGKQLVGDLLKNQLADGLKEAFLEQFHLTPADIIELVYRRPFPNRFLASLSPFLARHLDDAGIRRLIRGSFLAFIRRNVMQYTGYKECPVHFTGSIAYHYRELLMEAAAETGLRIGRITQSPMEGLIRYHGISGTRCP